ncbi:MAG: hypothetical protein ACXVMS_11810 [Flavisolibacter sp.]
MTLQRLFDGLRHKVLNLVIQFKGGRFLARQVHRSRPSRQTSPAEWQQQEKEPAWLPATP